MNRTTTYRLYVKVDGAWRIGGKFPYQQLAMGKLEEMKKAGFTEFRLLRKVCEVIDLLEKEDRPETPANS
jgi:hypothetical protein